MKINNKYYIGKDVCIERQKRIKEHIWMLKKGNHYNSYLQKAYLKYLETFDSGIIEKVECTLEELIVLEREYIQKYDAYKNGYNLTTGGEGLGGYKFTPKQIERKRQNVMGQKNPMSKLTEEQFFEIVEHLKRNKTNLEIAVIYDLNPGYVSLIRHKKRYHHLWPLVEDYEPTISEQQLKNRGKITEKMFIDIVTMIRNGETNAFIERKYGLSAGTASRIRHKKLYKQWWNRLV
ncbi:nuclease [Bacillus massiliigorillae]|uniref:nuclease n=1 Tax=Bacillus massiliigorillae TaxID=1243664 RepID=UPI001E2B2693|nr:nuclease [Bacillus massiliigorillae]